MMVFLVFHRLVVNQLDVIKSGVASSASQALAPWPNLFFSAKPTSTRTPVPPERVAKATPVDSSLRNTYLQYARKPPEWQRGRSANKLQIQLRQTLRNHVIQILKLLLWHVKLHTNLWDLTLSSWNLSRLFNGSSASIDTTSAATRVFRSNWCPASVLTIGVSQVVSVHIGQFLVLFLVCSNSTTLATSCGKWLHLTNWKIKVIFPSVILLLLVFIHSCIRLIELVSILIANQSTLA